MDKGFDISWVGGSKYHGYGVWYTIGRGLIYQGKGSKYYGKVVRYIVYRGFDLPWVRAENTMGMGVNIPWLRGSKCHGNRVDISWIRGPIHHGKGVQNTMDRRVEILWIWGSDIPYIQGLIYHG